MKKTNKVKMSPLGTPLGNPLGYFNSLKGKTKVEPKQTLRKAQNGLIAGPFDENTSKWLDKRYPSTALKFEGPIDPKEELKIRNKEASDKSYHMAIDNINSSYAVDKQQRKKDEAALRGNWHINRFNSEPMRTKEDVENPNKISKPTYYKKGGVVKKYQKGGYTVTNADGSPMTTPEGYRPPSVPSYPDFKKLRKTNPVHPAFMQLAKNPEEFDPKDVKKYGPKKPNKRMIKKMNEMNETAPIQATPYKKGGSTKTLPKAQSGGLLKLIIRATKPLPKTLKPIAKKIVSKSKTTPIKKFNYPKDKVKNMFPRVAEDIKKFNSVTDPKKLFERKTIKEQMKQWDKAAELKQQKKYPVLKNKN